MLKVIIGCSICGYHGEKNIGLPYNCDDIICPDCAESNCLYIVRVIEDKRAKKIGIHATLLENLYQIREL